MSNQTPKPIPKAINFQKEEIKELPISQTSEAKNHPFPSKPKPMCELPHVDDLFSQKIEQQIQNSIKTQLNTVKIEIHDITELMLSDLSRRIKKNSDNIDYLVDYSKKVNDFLNRHSSGVSLGTSPSNGPQTTKLVIEPTQQKHDKNILDDIQKRLLNLETFTKNINEEVKLVKSEVNDEILSISKNIGKAVEKTKNYVNIESMERSLKDLKLNLETKIKNSADEFNKRIHSIESKVTHNSPSSHQHAEISNQKAIKDLDDKLEELNEIFFSQFTLIKEDVYRRLEKEAFDKFKADEFDLLKEKFLEIASLSSLEKKIEQIYKEAQENIFNQEQNFEIMSKKWNELYEKLKEGTPQSNNNLAKSHVSEAGPNDKINLKKNYPTFGVEDENSSFHNRNSTENDTQITPGKHKLIFEQIKEFDTLKSVEPALELLQEDALENSALTMKEDEEDELPARITYPKSLINMPTKASPKENKLKTIDEDPNEYKDTLHDEKDDKDDKEEKEGKEGKKIETELNKLKPTQSLTKEENTKSTNDSSKINNNDKHQETSSETNRLVPLEELLFGHQGPHVIEQNDRSPTNNGDVSRFMPPAEEFPETNPDDTLMLDEEVKAKDKPQIQNTSGIWKTPDERRNSKKISLLINQSYHEGESEVIEMLMNEEGYLIKPDGTLVLDDNGKPILLTEEQIESVKNNDLYEEVFENSRLSITNLKN